MIMHTFVGYVMGTHFRCLRDGYLLSRDEIYSTSALNQRIIPLAEANIPQILQENLRAPQK